MGFINNLKQKGISLDSGIGVPRSPTDRGRGRELWQQIFGGTSKEEGSRPQGSQKPTPGGSFGRSMVSSDASYKRLLQAMRSMAPGGWSDDRWEQTRRFTGVNYVAIHRICSQLQQAEFQVFVKDRNVSEGKRPVTEHEPTHGDRLGVKPYDLVKLLERPNKQDSFGKWLYRIGQQKRLTGMALTWMVPNKLGVPLELYSVPTAIAIPQPAINPDFPDGYYRIQPIYPYGPFSSYPTPASAVGAPIPAQWMLRSLYPHPLLRYDGYSPLSGLRLHSDEVEMIDRSRFYSMKRSINPSAVLNMTEMDGSQPLREEEIERIHAEWENEFEGPENHGKLIVGTPGSTLEEWGGKPVDMEYPTGWDQLVGFLMGGGFGITKPAAGMVEDSSYSTLFATLKQLYLITLDPDCDDLASDLTHHLAPFFGDDLIIEIRCKRIDDHEINFTKIDKMNQAKCATKNEVRKLLDLPLTKEKWGDEISGSESQEGQEQPGMPGMEGMPQPGAAPPEQEQPQNPQEEEATNPEPPEIAAERPNPGTLSEGSLGPRKSLNGRVKKSPFRKSRRFSLNGVH